MRYRATFLANRCRANSSKENTWPGPPSGNFPIRPEQLSSLQHRLIPAEEFGKWDKTFPAELCEQFGRLTKHLEELRYKLEQLYGGKKGFQFKLKRAAPPRD